MFRRALANPTADKKEENLMAHAERIKTEKNGPVTTVTIDRPDARNACSVDMVPALHSAFSAFENDPTAKVAVLTGTDSCFCAGADLKEIHDGSAMGFCWAGTDQGVTRRYLEKPVIAGISGPALAAGLALAIWCDLRTADRDATFGVSCRRFGGPMPNGATVRLPRLIGQSHALDLMLTGRTIDAVEAHRMGLVNRVVEPGTARREAQALM
jgi:enoyl-CoA hydratase